MPDDSSQASPGVFRFRDSAVIGLDPAMPVPTASDSPAEVAASVTPKRKRSLVARVSAQEWAVSALLLLLDVVCWLGIYSFTSISRGNAYYSSGFVFFVVDLLQLTAIVTALYTIGGYDRSTEARSLVYATEHLLALSTAGLVSAGLIYSAATFDQSMKPSRSVILVSFIIFLPVSLEYRRWLRGKVALEVGNLSYLVIGCGQLARLFYEAYRESPNRQRLEFVDPRAERLGTHLAGPDSPIVEGDVEGKLSRRGRHYSGVILAEPVGQISPALLERLVRTQFQWARVYTLESFYESHWRYVPLDAIDPVWPLQTGFQLARNSPYHYLKRLSDIFAALVGMVIFAPIMALAMLLVWVGSGRPIFYSQTRIGRAGGPFTLYKLRTMTTCTEAEVGGEEIYTRDNDPRITRVGRFLRKLRLDELPQLWNVFTGEMSLIGPRAEWIKCAERYEKLIPFYHFRHLVKPGITGWAQVNYPYGENDQDAIEKLKYDLYYIRQYSLKLDAMIALKTVHVMLFSRGR